MSKNHVTHFISFLDDYKLLNYFEKEANIPKNAYLELCQEYKVYKIHPILFSLYFNLDNWGEDILNSSLDIFYKKDISFFDGLALRTFTSQKKNKSIHNALNNIPISNQKMLGDFMFGTQYISVYANYILADVIIKQRVHKLSCKPSGILVKDLLDYDKINKFENKVSEYTNKYISNPNETFEQKLRANLENSDQKFLNCIRSLRKLSYEQQILFCRHILDTESNITTLVPVIDSILENSDMRYKMFKEGMGGI